ncbi:death-associated inhibitor of apoptosis 2-like isoform X2 [Contarinia nasturtii]|uniref:death-associated inhibitor of apoptosis 2-like isoform X2 n=1 Tax=Contarinia nasturtii TaxID=265458 RepID=UPI0012D48BA8|nr:death-associated inhibitor of apoptosis 2-like isoform X2 [Contarinia nasturtii]
MNVEENRLQTFSNWPEDAPVEAGRVARGGFFATGTGLEVQCHWCGLRISEWDYGDQVMGKHRRLKPGCPFITNPTSSGNVPINNLQPTTATPAAATTTTIATMSGGTELPGNDLMNEQCRLSTFTNWPVPYISPQTLAKAGFYYFNNTDQVKCAWCQGVIAKWEVGDNPFTEHLKFFPNCPRAQLGPNVEIQTEESIRSLGIQQIRAPKKGMYSSLDARLRSFANWPRSSIQLPETLATAGFYYENTDDQVLCFQCNGGLRSWQREDDAWFEHARWFPKCEFVQLVKGPQYIAQVQQQSRPTLNLDEAMSGEPVQKALSMGLSEGRIRAVTKYHLERFGSPFKCAEALIESVLDYQREEEQQQGLDDGDDDEEQSSSAIVREVGRILDTIFNNYHDSSTSSSTMGVDDYPNDPPSQSSQSTTISWPSSSTSTSSSTNSNNSDLARRDYFDYIVDARESREAINNIVHAIAAAESSSSSTSSPQKVHATNQIENDSSTVTENPTVPEICPSTYSNGNNSGDGSGSSSTASKVSESSTNESGTSNDNSNTTTKKLSLEEENRQLKDARLCKVCMDDDVAVVFLPCGHLVTCVQCAPSVTACPLCRTAIKAFVRTFLS